MINKLLSLLILSILWSLFSCSAGISGPAEGELALKNHLAKAKAGDYLVTIQNKNYTILLIRSATPGQLSVEEITVPVVRIRKQTDFSWKKWLQQGASKHTSWLMYRINMPEGLIQQVYSYTKNEWVTMPESQNFLSILLNLRFQPIPLDERKRVGPPHPSDREDRRPLWQPQLIVEGRIIPDVLFNGWRACWPKDGSELSGKMIEIYLPKEEGKYPSYFPYWLQVIGMTGKAKARIVDSGSLFN